MKTKRKEQEEYTLDHYKDEGEGEYNEEDQYSPIKQNHTNTEHNNNKNINNNMYKNKKILWKKNKIRIRLRGSTTRSTGTRTR